uniref:MFS transporter n=1 Tax=Nonomuraea pusilla TaxID=46177 RepID=UPI0006E21A9C|nr:MFS transporter [Nonomuraea pusilla]
MSSLVALLRVRGTFRAFSAALLGRLSYGTVFLSLTLGVAGASGSYAVAGTAMALFGLCVSTLSPLRAALIDRYGARRALPPMAAAYALLLGCLAVAVWRPGADAVPLCALAGAAGACAPPLGPTMRALWGHLAPGPEALQRAYGLDAVMEELIFVTGPLLAGLFLLVSPGAGVAASAVLVLTGTVAFASSPAVRAMDASREATRRGPRNERPGGWWRRGPLPMTVTVTAAAGLCLGAVSLLLVAFAGQRGQTALVPWLEAAQAAGSALGGLLYAAVPWRSPLRVRLALLAAGLGLAVALAGLAPGGAAMAAAVFAAGVFVSPLLTTGYLLADEAAGEEHRTQAGAWVNTALNTGVSAGNAGSGLLAGWLALPLCFAAAAVPVLASAAAAAGGVRRRTGAPAEPPPR